MPDMNGMECVRTIRERNSDSYIIVCSAFITKELSEDYALLGVGEVLSKPIQLDLFVKAVHRGMDVQNEGQAE
jgi:DNA-binding NarL/FixJ family response regulator